MLAKTLAVAVALTATCAALTGAEPAGDAKKADISAETRTAELDLRQKAIAADLQALRERQQRQVPAAARQALNDKLRAMADKKGSGDPDRLYQVSYIEGFIKDRSLAPAPSVVEGLKAFSDQLAERGIDLIFVPVGDNVLVHAWKLQQGVDPEADLWPGQTRALVALLENNVEVIDAAGLFRKHVAAGGEDPVNRYDHHWSGVGMQLIAKEIGERMQRYDFVRAAAADRKRFAVKKIDVTTPSQLISINGIDSQQEWAANIAKPEKWGLPPKSAAWQVLYDGQLLETPKVMASRIDPVLILGDSNVPHLSGWHGMVGAGFPEHLSMALGLVVAQRPEADGARIMPRRYAENLAQLSPQPRVIVLAIDMGNLFGRWDVFQLPPRKPIAASATFVGLDNNTRGNWKGVYGADGYKIIGDAERYPPYASFGGGGQVFRSFTPVNHMLGYANPDAGLHCDEMDHGEGMAKAIGGNALLKASSDDGERVAAAWGDHGGSKGFAVDIKLQDGQEHQVALYLPRFHWDYVTTLEVQDYTTRKVLVPGMDIKHGPTYAIFNVRGQVRFLLLKKGAPNAVAGIFFDPVKAETITVDARVVFATPAPNPKASTYKDALTTTVFAAEAAPEQKNVPANFSAIQWVMKDAKLLTPASDLAVGQRWRLTLTAWDAAVEKDKQIETLRRVDDTEFDADRPVYWVEKAEPIK
jgi:hypothetical protein